MNAHISCIRNDRLVYKVRNKSHKNKDVWLFSCCSLQPLETQLQCSCFFYIYAQLILRQYYVSYFSSIDTLKLSLLLQMKSLLNTYIILYSSRRVNPYLFLGELCNPSWIWDPSAWNLMLQLKQFHFKAFVTYLT